MRHPLHPLMVHIPVGMWIASFVSDIVFMVGGDSNLAVTAYYTMLIGLVGAIFAAITGLAEFVAIPKDSQPRALARTHLMLNVVVTVLYFINFLSRNGLEAGAPSLVTQGQFILSIFSIAVLGISGYIGGLMVYNHGIGYKPQLRDRERPEEYRKVA